MLKSILLFIILILSFGCSTLKVELTAPQGYVVKYDNIICQKITKEFSFDKNTPTQYKKIKYIRQKDGANFNAILEVTPLFKKKKIKRIILGPQKIDLNQIFKSNEILTIGIVSPDSHNKQPLERLVSRFTLNPLQSCLREYSFNSYPYTTNTWLNSFSTWGKIATIKIGSRAN